MSRQQSSPSAGGWTGGAAGASGLVLITVEEKAGILHVERTRSAHFVLGDDTPIALREVFEELRRFVADCRIDYVVLRRAQPTGKDAAGAKARRLEAALELIPTLGVHIVNNQSLGRWSEVHADEIPELEAPSSRDRWIYDAAIGAARLAFDLERERARLVNCCIR